MANGRAVRICLDCSSAVRPKAKAGEKTCPKCKTIKPRTEFGVRSNGQTKSWCKSCTSADNSARLKAKIPPTAEELLNRRRWTKYRLTPEGYKALWEEQEGKCAICRGELPLNVDHCHVTLKVRGLLCHNCNVGLGNFFDSVELLQAAINYLHR